MTKYILVALSVTGGILSGMAWSSWCSGLILLVAIVPFFLIENHLYENPERYNLNDFFIYILPGFMIFCCISLGWIRAVSLIAAICVITGLSFLMSFIFWMAHLVRIKAGNITGFTALISFWLAFEFLSLNSILLSPWLNIGNGLAKDIRFIQWYEVTGVAGGTLWIFLSNLFFTLFLVNLRARQNKKRFFLLIWFVIVIVPSGVSMIRYYTISKSEAGKNEVIIIQPNLDPYTEKYTIPFDVQLRKVINMADSTISEKTAWLITPETTVDDPVREEDMANNKYIIFLKKFAFQHPNVSIITGLVSSQRKTGILESKINSAGIADSSGNNYSHFNSAFRIDTSKIISVYHKSKLVPGFERQFSEGFNRLLNKILPDLGGTRWGYGVQKERNCFEHPVTKRVIAPIICYESVFGNYVADYVRKGAEALFILTNDGWWKSTIGYKQHLSYASIRAIETRRPVVRAANTGISCIIDIRGLRTMETGWWTETVLKGEISYKTVITSYVHYGDYLMRISSLLSILILLYVFISFPLRKIIRQLH
jgi:apolipoprotein N-acyltransferase